MENELHRLCVHDTDFPPRVVSDQYERFGCLIASSKALSFPMTSIPQLIHGSEFMAIATMGGKSINPFGADTFNRYSCFQQPTQQAFQ